MLLINPRAPSRFYPDESSRQIMLKTIAFFEGKGKRRIKEDDHKRVWYADFIEFQKKEKLFATLLTPTLYGGTDSRWDTWRNCEFNEILGFYGLAYWYTWQVSILGLDPSGCQATKHLRKGTSAVALSKHLPRRLRMSSIHSNDANREKADAMDIAPYELYALHGPDKVKWDTHDPVWRIIGECVEAQGLRWGGRWRVPHDPGHMELL